MTALLAFLLLVFGARVRPEGASDLDRAVAGLWRWTAVVVGILVVGEVADLLGASP